MNSNILKNFCILIVSYNSEKKIRRLLSSISKNITFYIVENSLNLNIKKNLEKDFKNINVIIPKENLGFANSLNLAVKKINKKFIIYMDSDVKLKTSDILNLLLASKKINKFGAITPKIHKQDYKNLIVKKNKNGLNQVSFNTGCVMLMKKDILKKMKYFDNHFFLYFEESDYYKRCIEKGFPIYMYDKVKIIHEGSSSIDDESRFEYKKIRNWHYCWSKFYYFKKHHGYLFGLSKTIPNLFKSIKNICICFFKFEFYKIPLHYVEIEGLICSYLLIKPFYRIKK
tara:strand:- start:230 stop:1084 length:855 start_codon:yes stop_codon:yes gene_type:complete